MTLAAPPEASSEHASGPMSAKASRLWRWTKRAVLAGLALVVLYAVVTFGQVWVASTQEDSAHAQAIVVLGAAQYNGRPSPVLEARLQHALDLYHEGRAPMIVVTGGRQQGDRFTEATTGYNWLVRRGVPDADILKEVNGRSTWESLRAVARFLEPRHVDDVILVSDAALSLRLRGVGDEVGLDPHISPPSGSRPGFTKRVRATARESAAVGLGRLISYERLTRLEP